MLFDQDKLADDLVKACFAVVMTGENAITSLDRDATNAIGKEGARKLIWLHREGLGLCCVVDYEETKAQVAELLDSFAESELGDYERKIVRAAYLSVCGPSDQEEGGGILSGEE